MPSAPSPDAPRRVLALDAARALGVVAMVFGHTLDALLSAEARARPAVVAYWKARGLTAPLFMLVAGWAVALVATRSGARGLDLLRARWRRVALLLLVGYALRFPGWDLDALLAGRPGPWEHLLAFDALHAIAVALLGVVVVLALPLRRRETGLLLLALAVAAVAFALRPPAPLTPRLPAGLPALALAQALGGTSPFPALPWVAYFFVGATVPFLFSADARRRAAALAGLGALLVAATCWQGVGTAPPQDPALIAFRIGVVFLLLAGLEFVPAGLAAAAAPLGRASLGVYAIHVPIVYGWSTIPGLAGRVGPRLAPWAALLVALAVLAVSVALQRLGSIALAAGGAALRRTRERLASPGPTTT